MTVLYYDCFSGISGDMNLGALVDIGVDPEYLKKELKKLKIGNFRLEFKSERRKGITGTRAFVHILDDGDTHRKEQQQYNNQEQFNQEQKTEPDHTHKHQDPYQGQDHTHPHLLAEDHHEDSTHKIKERNLKDIREIINNSSLNSSIKNRSLAIFQKVAEAEAKIHGKSIDEIHFHEVGAIDSIVDIVGAVLCLDYLKPDKVISSSVEVGGGFVKCEHGIFPVPAPATSEILKNIPVKSGAVQSETTTPTGAAILVTLVNEFTDKARLTIQKTGYGIGTKDFDIPNVLRVHLGEMDDGTITDIDKGTDLETQTAWILECNIDDMNPEFYGNIMDLLFEKGADDVFITPIIMKKARPASKISVLCRQEIIAEITGILITHTTTLGVRKHKVEKMMLKRDFQKVMSRYGPVTIKTAIYMGKRLRSKPEYEDCVRIAKENNLPVQTVYQEIIKLITSINAD